MKCLQCGSARIARNVRAIDHHDYGVPRDLMLQVYRKPDALIFKQAYTFPLRANVCADCGFVMFAVERDRALSIRGIQEASGHPAGR